jgi:MFS family permease
VARSTVRPLSGLIAADVISTLGSEMTTVALPWFVLVTTGSPARMGAVLAAEFAGLTLLGLASGRTATLLGPRRTMLGSDLARGALVVLIPALYALGWLSFPVILVIAFVVGGFFPAYQSSSRLITAGLVDDDEVRLTRANGLLNAVNETASFLGPPLGGLLVVLVGPASVLLFDAGSYALSFILIGTLVPRTRTEAPAEDTSVRSGLRYLWQDRRLRRLVIGVGVLEIGFTAIVATAPILALQLTGGLHNGVSTGGNGGASVAGWLLGAYGAGSVAGGLISTRARGTGGLTPALAIVGITACAWALLLPVPAWGRALAIGGIGVASGLFFPRFFASLTTQTPPALRARVLTAVMVALSAPGPIGFLGAGVLAQWTGSATACLLLVAIVDLVGALIVVSAFLDGGARMSRRVTPTPDSAVPAAQSPVRRTGDPDGP